MELDETRAEFAAQGLNVCAISYDSVEVLAHFAARKGIGIPLLSDPDSALIRQFGLWNKTIADTDARQYGIPHPGTFIVDEQGVVRHKYFEQKYIHRVTMPTILAHAFGQAPGAPAAGIHTDQVTITTSATQDRVRPGNRFTLVTVLAPAPAVHVYAPGAEAFGYHPLTLAIDPLPHCTVYPPRYPTPEIMRFPPLTEEVPVYTTPVRIAADIALGSRQELADALAAGALPIRGRLSLQACDETVCYAPQELPVAWEMVLEPMDTERVPEDLRRELRTGSR